MKKITVILFALLATLSLRADVLFYDGFDYSNGLIETDGLWQVYSPSTPLQDAYVTNNLLILDSAYSDSVDVPFTNDTGSSIIYASFTIKVTSLPSTGGGFFEELQDTNEDYVGRLFINREGTVVPNTYRIGIANFATSIATKGATNYPMDLATGITYLVVFSYDTNLNDTYPNGTLVINPASFNDYANSPAYATDGSGTAGQVADPISRIGFSQYANQGIMGIGDLTVGTSFSDVFTNIPAIPVVGVSPLSTNIYLGHTLQLYTAASGLGQLSYQWLSNNVPMVDDGVTVIGSGSNVLTLTALQSTANYSVAIANSAGSVTSSVAIVSIITTPTAPFFTSQPYSATNSIGTTITLSALANGTGPITYQWYFEPTNGGGFSAVGGQTGSTLSLTSANFNEAGYYYVAAANSVSTANSTTVTVTVTPPQLVTLGYLHSFITNYNGNYSINAGEVWNVQGIVTSIGQIESKTAEEFFLQDGTGGCLVYYGGSNPTNTPPVGALVSVVGPAESYYAELEMDPSSTSSTNTITILSTNNPVPAPTLVNFGQVATNNLGAYGLAAQCSLVTLTNVYLYSSAAGAAVSGTFAANTTKALYAFQQPNTTGAPYIEIYVYTYTNAANLLNTNYFSQTIPSFCYELTAPYGVYAPTTPEFYPTRFADFVTTPPAAFAAGISATNGVSTISWPAVVGSTYSVYSATNLLGPWTQSFGLSYYPSTGTLTVTNTAAGFYKVSTP
jgi:hypothetical protein